MSLNLISSLSFLKNKFESVAHGGGGKKRKDAAIVVKKTSAKVDLYAGITESDLDDTSSDSSDSDEDENLSSKATTAMGTPARGGSTGYSTPDSRLDDGESGADSKSGSGGGPTADILQKCLDILNSDISDSETLPQPDVVKSNKEGEGDNSEKGKIDDFSKDLVKPCIIPDYSQGLLKIASPIPRIQQGEEAESGAGMQGKESLSSVGAEHVSTKANKSPTESIEKDTFKSLSVEVYNKAKTTTTIIANLTLDRRLSAGGNCSPPPQKRTRYDSSDEDDSDEDYSSDDDVGPPQLEPMISLPSKTPLQPAIVNTSCTTAPTTAVVSSTQQSKFSSVSASVVTTAVSSHSQVCHNPQPTTVPLNFTSLQQQLPQQLPIYTSSMPTATTVGQQQFQLPITQQPQQTILSNLGQLTNAGGIQRILLPPVPAGQAQQIIIQPPAAQLQPQIIQQQQSFLGPNIPTVQIIQPLGGQPLQLGNALPLLNSTGYLLGSLAGVGNQANLLNNLQSFTGLLSHNSPQVIQQQQQNLFNYVHNNNNQFPHYPVIIPQTSIPSTTTLQSSQLLPQPKLIQPQLLPQQQQPQPQQVIIKQEPMSSSQSNIKPQPTTVNGIQFSTPSSSISTSMPFNFQPQQFIQNSMVGLAPQQPIISSSLPMPTFSSSQSTANTSFAPQIFTSLANISSTNTFTVNNATNASNITIPGGSGTSPVAQLVQDPVTGLYNLVSTHMPTPSSSSTNSAASSSAPTITSTPLSSKRLSTATPVSIPGLSSTPPVSVTGFAGTPITMPPVPIPGLTKTPLPLSSLTSSASTSILVTPDIKPDVSSLTSSPPPSLNRTSTPISGSPAKMPKHLLLPPLNSKENYRPLIAADPLSVAAAAITDNNVSGASYQLTTKFKCGVCNKYFGNTKNLRVHISEIHEGKRGQFPCDICHKVFPRKRNMERHKNALHLKNHPVCPLCQKAVVNIDVHIKRFHRGSQDHKKVSAATA